MTPDFDAIPQVTRERWAREVERCETRGQMNLVFECHRLEMLILRMDAQAKGT